MSYDYWWFSRRLPRDEFRVLRTGFEQALRSDSEAVDHTPLRAVFPGDVREAEDADRYNAMCRVFCPAALASFALGVLNDLSEDNTAGFVIASNCPPPAILWQALGPERFARLPGLFGNLMVAPEDVPATLTRVRALFAETSHDAMVAAGLDLCGFRNSRATVEDVLAHLPEALVAAQARDQGLLVMAREQF